MQNCVATVLNSLHVQVLLISCLMRQWYYPHLTDEEIKAQRGSITLPKVSQQPRRGLNSSLSAYTMSPPYFTMYTNSIFQLTACQLFHTSRSLNGQMETTIFFQAKRRRQVRSARGVQFYSLSISLQHHLGHEVHGMGLREGGSYSLPFWQTASKNNMRTKTRFKSEYIMLSLAQGNQSKTELSKMHSQAIVSKVTPTLSEPSIMPAWATCSPEMLPLPWGRRPKQRVAYLLWDPPSQ